MKIRPFFRPPVGQKMPSFHPRSETTNFALEAMMKVGDNNYDRPVRELIREQKITN